MSRNREREELSDEIESFLEINEKELRKRDQIKQPARFEDYVLLLLVY